MITLRTCPYCTEVFIFKGEARITSWFHEIDWQVRTSGHVVECRADWLSLVKSEPIRGLERMEETDLAN